MQGFPDFGSLFRVFRRGADAPHVVARPTQLDGDDLADLPSLHDDDTICEHDGFIEIVGNDYDGLAGLGVNSQKFAIQRRSEERRVGTECDSPCSSRWSSYHSKKTD